MGCVYKENNNMKDEDEHHNDQRKGEESVVGKNQSSSNGSDDKHHQRKGEEPVVGKNQSSSNGSDSDTEHHRRKEEEESKSSDGVDKLDGDLGIDSALDLDKAGKTQELYSPQRDNKDERHDLGTVKELENDSLSCRTDKNVYTKQEENCGGDHIGPSKETLGDDASTPHVAIEIPPEETLTDDTSTPHVAIEIPPEETLADDASTSHVAIEIPSKEILASIPWRYEGSENIGVGSTTSKAFPNEGSKIVEEYDLNASKNSSDTELLDVTYAISTTSKVFPDEAANNSSEDDTKPQNLDCETESKAYELKASRNSSKNTSKTQKLDGEAENDTTVDVIYTGSTTSKDFPGEGSEEVGHDLKADHPQEENNDLVTRQEVQNQLFPCESFEKINTGDLDIHMNERDIVKEDGPNISESMSFRLPHKEPDLIDNSEVSLCSHDTYTSTFEAQKDSLMSTQACQHASKTLVEPLIEPRVGDNIDDIVTPKEIQIKQMEREKALGKSHEDPIFHDDHKVGVYHHGAKNFQLEEHYHIHGANSIPLEGYPTSLLDMQPFGPSSICDLSLQEKSEDLHRQKDSTKKQGHISGGPVPSLGHPKSEFSILDIPPAQDIDMQVSKKLLDSILEDQPDIDKGPSHSPIIHKPTASNDIQPAQDLRSPSQRQRDSITDKEENLLADETNIEIKQKEIDTEYSIVGDANGRKANEIDDSKLDSNDPATYCSNEPQQKELKSPATTRDTKNEKRKPKAKSWLCCKFVDDNDDYD